MANRGASARARWRVTVKSAFAALALACGGGAGSGGSGSGPQSERPGKPTPGTTAKTIVSLTFDDGGRMLWPARDIMAANGQRGTFYVISGNIGHPSYLTLDELRQLQAEGHEIGGHTLSHMDDLTSQKPEVQRHEVCDDRAALVELGFPAESFAYPFNGSDPELEQVVAQCGYSSARKSRGLANESCTNTCPVAESIPPGDPFAIRTVTTVQSTATLEDLKRSVLAAEQGAGGWVTFVFHRFCDPVCADTAITPALFAEFSRWLAEQDVAVLPVREAMKLRRD